MNFLGSKLSKFDVHSKAVDGVHQQTAIGAFVTVIAYCFITFLLYSEVNMRLKSNVVSRMVLDDSGSSQRISTTRIAFDVEFYKLACDRITFAQEVTRGEHHNATSEIMKDPILILGLESCRVHGSLVTDKVGGNFRFEVSALKALSPKTLEGDKNFTIAQEIFDHTPPDISHKINHVMFIERNLNSPEEDIPTPAHDHALSLESNPLNGQESAIPVGVGIHQYSIQVVPTTFRSTKGQPKNMNQYSVTERQVDFMQALSGVTVAGQYFSDFVGLVFTYDFYPVRFEYSRQPFLW
jgi:Endoplasmic reticulum vesicle transporter/Endoplasmic Reticulum-Golgi Intermediate Compartment (ERGIC)